MKFCNLKKGVLFILLVLSFSAGKAQAIRGFGNVTAYSVSNDFKKGAIVYIGGGAEFEFHPLFKPEVSLSYSLMGLNDQEFYDFDTNTLEKLSGDVYMLNFNVGPKIYFWYSGETFDSAACWYYIVPKINMSRIVANGNYQFIDYDDPQNNLIQKGHRADWQHSFGLTLGMEFPIFNSDAIALSVTVNKTNMGKTLNRLPYNNTDYGTLLAGAGISYYFGIKK
ncbi:hypothetical protein [Flavobacterium ginsenosidimutans]|uniref:Outer membrane protein beta-barrel domain-containing protein n=1 Tax=Flavobacterium ginsenosidimutans TaxID=687844 RepID=A0ABZ2Q527_9FLAO